MTRWWTVSGVKGLTSGYTQTSSSLLSTQVPDLMPASQTVKQPHWLLLEMLLHWLFFVQIAQCVSTSLSSCLYILVLLEKKNISVSCFAWSHHSVVYLLWPFLYFILFFYVLCQVGCSSLTWKGPWIGLWSGAASTLCSSLDNVVIIDTDLQQKHASLAVNWGSRS